MSNLLKYAFNLSGAGPDVSQLAPGSGGAGLPFFGVASSVGGAVFRVEYLRRRNAGLVYTLKVSPSLASASFEPLAGTESVAPINDDWERVSVEQPLDPEKVPRLFGVVEVRFAEE